MHILNPAQGDSKRAIYKEFYVGNNKIFRILYMN